MMGASSCTTTSSACAAMPSVDIADAGLDALSLPDTSGFGFEVKDFRVQLRGLCRSCRKKEDKK